jgi:hypothetical protein
MQAYANATSNFVATALARSKLLLTTATSLQLVARFKAGAIQSTANSPVPTNAQRM